MTFFVPLYGIMLTDQPLQSSSKREMRETLKRNPQIRKSYDNAVVLGGPNNEGPSENSPAPASPSVDYSNQTSGPKGPGEV